MAGLPTIQPSSPAKLMDWNLRGNTASCGKATAAL
jgi:hypothetical protein